MLYRKIVLELPETIILAARVKQKELPSYLKKTLAVEFYREGILSLGKAAELAEVSNKWEMLKLLNERKVKLSYTAEDAENDLETLEGVLG